MHRGTLLTAGTAALMLFGAACDDDDDPIGVGSPASIRIVGGCPTGASAGAGLALADSVVAEVRDSRNNLVPNATVTFAVATGGGSVSPTTAATNAQGQAKAKFTLGTVTGPNSLTASVSGVPQNATCSAAALERFTTQLSGQNERPAVTTTGSGSANLVVDASGQSITLTVDYAGLSSNVTGAHIHGPFDPAGTANTAGIIFGFPNFPTTPSGTYTVTITPNSTFTGSFTYAQLLDLVRQGRTYVNIHTSNNPGGEIRGQLVRP